MIQAGRSKQAELRPVEGGRGRIALILHIPNLSTDYAALYQDSTAQFVDCHFALVLTDSYVLHTAHLTAPCTSATIKLAPLVLPINDCWRSARIAQRTLAPAPDLENRVRPGFRVSPAPNKQKVSKRALKYVPVRL